MPWKGVTVSEQRQRFLEDYVLNYCSATDLTELFKDPVTRQIVLPWSTDILWESDLVEE
jgi:hypothetical protein